MEQSNNTNRLVILYAEDDSEDQMLMRDAYEEGQLDDQLKIVNDGEELMDYLYRRNHYSDPVEAPVPDIILLDLNLPKIDGREALKTIKEDPELKKVPVIALTTSKTEEDIQMTYELGVNSFITKPIRFDSLVKIMIAMKEYWGETVELPSFKKSKTNE